MRILFIAPYIPSRIRVRPFQLIRGLAKNHEVHVLVLGGSDKQDVDGVDEVMALSKSFRVIPHSKLRGYFQSLLALPTRHPMCAAFCWSRLMRGAVDQAVSDAAFDVIHVEHLRAGHFANGKCGVPVVFDSVDCLTGLFRQMSGRRKNPLAKMLMREEAWKLKRYEPRLLRGFDRVVVTSNTEIDELHAMDRALDVRVLPNGVDTDYFAPMDVEKHPRRIVFSGKMSYHPNAQAAMWFAEKVFPALLARWPDAQFVIVGSGPPPEVKRLEANPGIVVTGYVDHTRPYLASAAVAVVPMQIAVGIQNKVLEAMAMGLPVVVSPAAARAFQEGCPGIVVADGMRATIEEVQKLMADSDVAESLGRSGRQVALSEFSWDNSVRILEDIYSGVVADREK